MTEAEIRDIENDEDNMSMDTSLLPGEEVDLDAELASLYSSDSDIAELDKASELSEDLSGFASGFPDWDLHPF